MTWRVAILCGSQDSNWMNAPEAEACKKLASNIDTLGLATFRRQSLQGLKLKTVIKVLTFNAHPFQSHAVASSLVSLDSESTMTCGQSNLLTVFFCVTCVQRQLKVQESHGTLVTAIEGNRVDAECSNLFATTGADQVCLAGWFEQSTLTSWCSLKKSLAARCVVFAYLRSISSLFVPLNNLHLERLTGQQAASKTCFSPGQWVFRDTILTAWILCHHE